MPTMIIRTLALLVAAIMPVTAFASGFALRETSASGQGTAFAGATAAAEDVSYMAFNPAGLTRHHGDHGIFTVTGIAPSAEFKKDRSTTVLGATIGGGNGGSDVAPDALAPALYLSHQFSPRLFGGVSLTVPFGLATDYDFGLGRTLLRAQDRDHDV